MDEWQSDDGGKKGSKKGSKGSTSDWYCDKDKGFNGIKGQGKGKGKSETRCGYDYGEQGHIGVNCPHRWTTNIVEEDDQEKVNLRVRRQKNLRAWRHLMMRENGVGPNQNRITRWGKRVDQGQYSITLQNMTKKSKCLED